MGTPLPAAPSEHPAWGAAVCERVNHEFSPKGDALAALNNTFAICDQG